MNSRTCEQFGDPLEEWLPQLCAMSVEAKLAARTPRTGIFFVVHESLLPELEYEERVDVYAEFLSLHPNHDPRAQGFVMIKLSNAQIASQHARIRMSSYRWRDVKGVGGDEQWAIPANYGWFLDHIKENRQIGWMDFLANVAVNVAVPEVIGYMGELYATSITVGDWLLEMGNLSAALPRGWVSPPRLEPVACFIDQRSGPCRGRFSKRPPSASSIRPRHDASAWRCAGWDSRPARGHMPCRITCWPAFCSHSS